MCLSKHRADEYVRREPHTCKLVRRRAARLPNSFAAFLLCFLVPHKITRPL
jgi:hypothetical protein